MDQETQSEFRELRRLLAGVTRMLTASLKSKAPKPKPKPRPAAAPRVETELERVQRHFEFLREHGGVMAEGRYDRATGEFNWRR